MTAGFSSIFAPSVTVAASYTAASLLRLATIKIGYAMKYGYARVSTIDQNPDLQIQALKSAGCERVRVEHGSGKNDTRPVLSSLVAELQEGDTLCVWKLDRLARSTLMVIATVNDLAKRGIDLEILDLKIDTSTPTGKGLLQIMAVIAEIEHNLMLERTLAGLAAARARGRIGGRRPTLAPHQVRQALEMRDRNFSVREVARVVGCAPSTLYNYPEIRNAFRSGKTCKPAPAGLQRQPSAPRSE